MTKNRLEAFSDGVIAILITIMILELKTPHGDDLAALRPLVTPMLSYLLSFVYLGIYWNNHHHMLHATERVNGAILWANMHLLFWLSLIPFATAWMGEAHGASLPTACYGVIMIASAIAYTILQLTIVAHHGPDSKLARAIGSDLKGKISLACYAASIAAAFWEPNVSRALFVTVALIWLVPDRRIERKLQNGD
jgi:uncharacterized membrane protein